MAEKQAGKPRESDDERGAEEPLDPLGAVASLPRVEEIGWIVKPVSKRPEKKKKKPKTAPVGFRLRPFTPKAKKSMVTMSDLGMGGRARTGTPARVKRKPRPRDEDEAKS